MKKPTLYAFSGLPGSGKSTLAQALSKMTGFAYLRIDTIEQGLRDLCDYKVAGEGYRLSYRIAQDNLKLGINVVADSCNPIELTRAEWNEVAIKSEAELVNIEVICSDISEHRHRVENRDPTIETLKMPTWEDVKNREYDSWSSDRIVIDTAGRPVAKSVQALFTILELNQDGE